MKKGIAVVIIILFLNLSIIQTTVALFAKNKTQPELIIDGPTNGKAGEPYTYTIILIDPDECQFYLNINWGDGMETDWIGPFASNGEIDAGHTWDKQGIYFINAYARDVYDNTYNATLEVTMPKNQNMQFGWLSRFPLLQRLLSLPIFERMLNK